MSDLETTTPENEKPLILLVDDEPMLRQMLAESFEDEGYKTAEAENGQVALDFIKSNALCPCLLWHTIVTSFV